MTPLGMRTAEEHEACCLSSWWPKLAAAGVPTPDTRIVRTDVELVHLLDGVKPAGYDQFEAELQQACDELGGAPVFLRTGQGSDKHEWSATCHVTGKHHLGHHIAMLTQWSLMVDWSGLPYDVWCVREMIDTRPLFYAFLDMPITREFRVFIRDGVVEHLQPYWPPESIEDADRGEWPELLARASELTGEERGEIEDLAGRSCHAVGGGYWSVDCLQDRHGKWWVTDMALGDLSYRWDPEDARS